jgi:hypothetical protein
MRGFAFFEEVISRFGHFQTILGKLAVPGYYAWLVARKSR